MGENQCNLTTDSINYFNEALSAPWHSANETMGSVKMMVRPIMSGSDDQNTSVKEMCVEYKDCRMSAFVSAGG